MEKNVAGICVRCVKFAPLLLLVPVIRRLRAHKPEPPKRHLLFGH